jgi:hypothetical protein
MNDTQHYEEKLKRKQRAPLHLLGRERELPYTSVPLIHPTLQLDLL